MWFAHVFIYSVCHSYRKNYQNKLTECEELCVRNVQTENEELLWYMEREVKREISTKRENSSTQENWIEQFAVQLIYCCCCCCTKLRLHLELKLLLELLLWFLLIYFIWRSIIIFMLFMHTIILTIEHNIFSPSNSLFGCCFYSSHFLHTVFVQFISFILYFCVIYCKKSCSTT